MEVTSGAEEGFVREWAPCSHILNLIPARIQAGIFSSELCLTCVDAVSEFIALGTNLGLVYWYDRKKGTIQRLRCVDTAAPITYVKIVSTVDYMVGAGNSLGQVTVFQIPKEHPENVPDTFKPKVEPKVERYTIGDLHKSAITSIEWSKNGMRLFSGDKNGVIIMTEIDFYMHLCKSMEIVNEEHEIVQMSYCQGALLVSSVYRAIVCEHRAARWHVAQLGKKERRSLCALGAVFQYSYAVGGAPAAYCARPGLRLWRADRAGDVHQTLLFKEAISNPLTVAELLNPSQRKHSLTEGDRQLGPLRVFRDHFLVAHDQLLLYILDPRSLTAVAVVDDLRRILSVSVTNEEIFVLEGPRSLVRLAHAPEPPALAAEEPASLMSKSLTSSLQQAVNTVRDLAHMDHTVPYIAGVLEQPMAMFTKPDATGDVANAEECFELPPIKHLPRDISDNVLESIINEFKDVSSDAEEIRRVKSEELQRKLKLYNSIMEKKYDEELIHSSRRSRRGEAGSGGCTPGRRPAPGVSYTAPCVMSVSGYGNIPQQNDDLLEKQIEEKEKILAKMLNLESLSITSPKPDTEPTKEEDDISAPYKQNIEEKPVSEPKEYPRPLIELKTSPKPVKKSINALPNEKIEQNPINLVPKVVKLPNNWNLENIELKLEMQSNGVIHARNLVSPDDALDGDWEII